MHPKSFSNFWVHIILQFFLFFMLYCFGKNLNSSLVIALFSGRNGGTKKRLSMRKNKTLNV